MIPITIIVLNCQSYIEKTEKNWPYTLLYIGIFLFIVSGCEKKQVDQKMFATPLKKAIERGMTPKGNLKEELYRLGEYKIRSRSDAEAICKALENLLLDKNKLINSRSPLFALTSLFQNVESVNAPAYDIMAEKGIPLLIRIN